MNLLRRQYLENLQLKCEDTLSLFKKKRRDNFVQFGDTQYDDHVRRLLSLTHKIEGELRCMEAAEDIKVINELIEEHSHTELIDSLQREYENVDKDSWYREHFDNWKQMPPRQECDTYPFEQRLIYSRCRLKMFNHLEDDWKKQTFPTLADRLEFF
jgi:hypothetical protein